MNEERFDADKAKRKVKLLLPFVAIFMIIAFIALPVKFWNTALRKEAEAKNRPIQRVVEFDLFKWLK
jgi:hypothetical protein